MDPALKIRLSEVRQKQSIDLYNVGCYLDGFGPKEVAEPFLSNLLPPWAKAVFKNRRGPGRRMAWVHGVEG
uniref:Uncharacterized protein n=1 Tax=Oryza meyeriana var. granulata TaxID=110450 RepID=A0A1V1H5X9_9ORYZ|nr:hypothetical protein [Oryza meyeriana var. granulata]